MLCSRLAVERFADRNETSNSMQGDTSLYGSSTGAVNVDAGMTANIAAQQQSALMRHREAKAKAAKEAEEDSDGGWESDG